MRGEAADFIGIVLEGEIHILQDDYYGNRSITASVGAGSLFAEAFVCAGVPQLMVDIAANTDCSILFLSSENILNPHDVKGSFHDILIRNLLGIVARKNMYLNRKLKYAAQKTTAQKLLAALEQQLSALCSRIDTTGQLTDGDCAQILDAAKRFIAQQLNPDGERK